METNSLFIGSDPEFFVLNKNKPVSAISVLNCGKDERIDLGNNIKVFYDNVLLEMNINPSNSCAGLISSIQDALYRVAQHISPFVIEPIASMNFPESELKHPDARVFGCSPEFDAYEMCVVPPNHEATQLPFRSGGGHIHLGYSKEEFPLIAPIKDDDTTERDWGRIWVVRMMDLFVGIPALFVDHDPTSAARRKLYGKCGSHRPKDYGVEYRAPSNFWLKSPKLVKLIYNLSDFVVNFVRENKHMSLWEDEYTCKTYSVENMCQIINNSDIQSAKKIMEDIIKKHLPSHLYAEIFRLSEPTNYNFYQEWQIA